VGFGLKRDEPVEEIEIELDMEDDSDLLASDDLEIDMGEEEIEEILINADEGIHDDL